jgi:hypothetical protein
MSGIHAMLISGGGGVVGGSGSVTLNNATVDSQNGGADASASWRIDSDGWAYEGYNGTYYTTNQWTGDAVANYEVRATVEGGSTPTGSATATWLSCSTDRDWTVTDTTFDELIKQSNLLIEVRDVATATVRASCYVDLYAERIS